MYRKRKHSFNAVILALIGTVFALIYINRHYPAIVSDEPLILNHKPANVALPPITSIRGDTATSSTTTGAEIPTPETLSLPVPFTPQAPTANWDTLHGEACEEASAIMANAYFSGMTDTTLKPDFVEQQISMLTQWEQDNFGYYLDINSEETAKMIETNYGLHAKVISDYTQADIKKELAQNHLILLPTNGKLLGNPNFRSPGPPYHMLVLRGFIGDTIITNDPGTRKGLNYPYSFKTLYIANGNFDHETHEVDTTDKNYISVWK